MKHKPKMGHQAAMVCWVSATLFSSEALLTVSGLTDAARVGFLLIAIALILAGASAWISE